MPLHAKHKRLIGLVFEFKPFYYFFTCLACGKFIVIRIHYQVVTDCTRINGLVMRTVYLPGRRTRYLMKQRIVVNNDRVLFVGLFFFMSFIAIVKVLDEFAAF